MNDVMIDYESTIYKTLETNKITKLSISLPLVITEVFITTALATN